MKSLLKNESTKFLLVSKIIISQSVDIFLTEIVKICELKYSSNCLILTAGEQQYRNTLHLYPVLANGIRTGDPCGFNKGRRSKFCEGSRVRQTPEEG